MLTIQPLDRSWKFRTLTEPAAPAWREVDLPHTPFVPDLDGRDHWFGLCEYRRTIQRPAAAPAGKCMLYCGAAMHTAVVLVDGKECGRHSGGYLPFETDVTGALADGRPHELTLLLDNRENADVPPGKPYADLDFCWYGGLYRIVELRCYPEVHITDAITADAPGSGGVFIRTLAATPDEARISVQVHFCSRLPVPREISVEVEIGADAVPVAASGRTQATVARQAAQTVVLELTVPRPALWQPDSPALYQANVRLFDEMGALLDGRTVRFGIRRIAFSRSGGFVINGKRMRLRGTNRHQEHPRAGYAVPASAERRDARRIKEAGFDFVRLSHYPQSTDFLDACDELGIVVMNCIPGWQFMGGERFRDACLKNARELIRRDRNHPSVVLWELSLNETRMDEPFMSRLQSIGHEEYPGDQMFTCGWQDSFDVYLHSRQHGEIHRWRNGDKALVVGEYGDWEFYASNDGFDQKTGSGLFAKWSHGRQFRKDGERGLKQQALNHVLALNDTLSSPAVLDGVWSMFDYARGYDPVRAACGIMDVFRLPKYSYHFYRSQRSAAEEGENWRGGAMVFIASDWTPASDLRILVFSNCEAVELRHNGAVVGKQAVQKSWMTQYLPHPPFVFDLPAFVPGTLEAVGYIRGQRCAAHSISTPRQAVRMKLELDQMDIHAGKGQPDLLFGHARILDEAGTTCINHAGAITFGINGGAAILGPSTVAAEAGVASAVVAVRAETGEFTLTAGIEGGGLAPVSLHWQRDAGEDALLQGPPRRMLAVR